MVNVGDTVRVARDEGKYWLGAEGVVASREERENASNIIHVSITKLLNDNDVYELGGQVSFYEDSVDVIEPAIGTVDMSVILADEEAVRVAAEYLGVDVTPVYRVLELARRMKAFADETEGD